MSPEKRIKRTTSKEGGELTTEETKIKSRLGMEEAGWKYGEAWLGKRDIGGRKKEVG